MWGIFRYQSHISYFDICWLYRPLHSHAMAMLVKIGKMAISYDGYTIPHVTYHHPILWPWVKTCQNPGALGIFHSHIRQPRASGPSSGPSSHMELEGPSYLHISIYLNSHVYIRIYIYININIHHISYVYIYISYIYIILYIYILHIYTYIWRCPKMGVAHGCFNSTPPWLRNPKKTHPPRHCPTLVTVPV